MEILEKEEEEFPPEFQKLVQGLLLLNSYVQEERKFGKALARGDLSMEPPKADNVLAAPLKELQGSLRHLAWQTLQVAKGDYSQRVDFMGEFSQAFNTMTEQLSERTAGLIEEKKLVEQKNEELKCNLELVMALTNYTHNMIFVFSESAGSQIFMNQSAELFLKTNPEKGRQIRQCLRKHNMADGTGSDNWDMDIDSGAARTEACIY